VQPPRPGRVVMAVGEKCAILEIHVPGPRLKRHRNVSSMQNWGSPFKNRLELGVIGPGVRAAGSVPEDRSDIPVPRASEIFR
jgi:hypothetical protein